VSAGAGRTALVTGGAGFLGSHLVESLVADGFRVRVLDDLSTGRLENLDAVRTEVSVARADVVDATAVRQAARGADLVFHLAARSGDRASFDDPVGSHATNAEGTLCVLQAAREAGVRRLVFASSWRVYGDTAARPLAETDPVAPASPYGTQKACGELYCRLFYRLHSLETVALRYFNLFGPRQCPDGEYRAGDPRAGEVDAGTQDLVFVEDAVRATRLAAEASGAPGLTVNVGGSGPGDPSRAREVLGYEPRGGPEPGRQRRGAGRTGVETPRGASEP